MDVCKCVHCEYLDVNAKTTFCKLNNESTCTDNDIPCPLELEVKSDKKEVMMTETLEDYDSYNEYCREEEIKSLKEAIAWTEKFEVSEPINGRSAHICRYYLYKRLNELGGAE